MTGGRTNIPLLKTDLGTRGLGDRVALFNSKGELVGYALKSDFSGTPSGGTDGLSAYEIAVNNGFVGNEQSWLLSLKGDKGDKGERGAPGGGGTGSSSDIYSLEEKLYGVWINGENMYRKCFEINIDSLKEGTYSTDSTPYKLYHNLGIKDIKEGYLIKFIENTVNSTINFKDLIISGGDSEHLNLDCLEGLTSDWILVLEYIKN